MTADVKEIYMLMLSNKYGVQMLDEVTGKPVDACLLTANYVIQRMIGDLREL